VSEYQNGIDGLAYECVDPSLGDRIHLLASDLPPSWERAALNEHLEVCHHCRIIHGLPDQVRRSLVAGREERSMRHEWLNLTPSSWLAAAALLLLISLTAVFWPEISHSFGPSAGFIANHGQVDAEVRFFAPGSLGAAYFTEDAIVFDLRQVDQDSLLAPEYRHVTNTAHPRIPFRGCALRLRFTGAGGDVKIEGSDILESRFHYFQGKDPEHWERNVRAYRELHFRDLWPQGDLVFGEQDGRLVYELRGGTNPEQFSFTYEGADSVVRLPGGDIAIYTSVGVLVEHRPDRKGEKGYFVWERELRPGLDRTKGRSGSGLAWSSFLGGNEMKSAATVGVGPRGDIYVAGFTSRLFYPRRSGAYYLSRDMDPYDAYLTKLSADGRHLLWQATLGGRGHRDAIHDLKVDEDGTVVVTGITNSIDFPMYERAYAGDPQVGEDPGKMYDTFLLRIGSAGDQLLGGTFLSGDLRERGDALALSPGGDLILAGSTISSNFPLTAGVFDAHGAPRGPGSADVMVCRLNRDCSELQWSTLIAGGHNDQATSVALDAEGNIFLAGITASPDFPTSERAFRRVYSGGNYDAFACKLSGDGSSLLWSSFLGGSGDWDNAHDIHCDDDGDLFLVGSTYTADFPTTLGAFDLSYNHGEGDGGNDIILAKFDGEEGELLWASFLGGLSTEIATNLELDEVGNLVVSGHSASRDFPAAGSRGHSHNGGAFDVVVARMSTDGSRLLGASYLGGAGDDWCWGMALDGGGHAILVGHSSSLDFPVSSDGFDQIHNGYLYDSYITKLALPGEPES
jgi:hypothetical protein